MTDTRIILLEGMPSTGKTTNARFMQIQLERNGVSAKWIHEIATPHPLLFYDEAGMTRDEYDGFIRLYPHAAAVLNGIAEFKGNDVFIPLIEIQWKYLDTIGEEAYRALLEHNAWNLPLEAYKRFALVKWAGFSEKALENRGEVYIIDGAVFQYQVFIFLLKNRPYGELQNFIDRLIKVIMPLNPRLIFLRRKNAEASIDYLENDRGTPYLDYIWQRDKDQPYYADKPAKAEGFKQFLRDYSNITNLLFDRFPSDKISIDVSDGKWICHEDKILSYLNVNRAQEPDAYPQNGVYFNEATGFEIIVDGLSITDPNGNVRPLYTKSQNEFYVDWIPTILRFENGKIIISGSQTGNRWTETGTVYTKTK